MKTRSNPYSHDDPYGARADAEWDQIQEASRLNHLDGECNPATCDYCQEDRDRADESEEVKEELEKP